MKTSTTYIKCHQIILVLFFLISAFAQAQLKNSFDARFNEPVNGDFTMIANNMVSSSSTGNYNGGNNNQDFSLVYVDIDGNTGIGANTFNSSRAEFKNPAPSESCLTIKKVILYWAASDLEPGATQSSENQPAWDYDDIKLMLPGETDYTDYDADEVLYRGRDDNGNGIPNEINDHFSNDPYICVKDITTLVTDLVDNGDEDSAYGNYQVANVEGKIGNLLEHDETNPSFLTGVSGGWQIVFVYESPLLPLKNISIYDGYAHVTSETGASNYDVTINGFQTVPFPQDVSIKILTGALEGDRNIDGDELQIQNVANNFIPLTTDPTTPIRDSDNFFNSRITVDNNNFIDRAPASQNTTGFDAAIFQLDNTGNLIIGNDQTSATFRLTSDSETYGVFLLGLSVDIFEPNLGPIEILTSASSTPQAPGTTIVGSFTVDNKGNDDAENVTIFSTLPPQIISLLPAAATPTTHASLPGGVTYQYNTITNFLEFFVDDSLVTVGSSPIDVEFDLQIKDECYFLADTCDLTSELEFTATYNGVINPETQTTSSSSNIDACGVGNDTPTIINVIQPTISWDTASGELDTTVQCNDSAGLTTAQGLVPLALTPLGNDCNLIPLKTSGPFVPDAGCANAGTYTNTWNFTDECGVTIANFTQVITVTDTVDPILANIPAAVTISCEDTVPGSGTVTATDSCSGDITGDIIFTAGTLVADPTCPNSGTITHTWTVNDGCGNTDTQTQVITVTDTVDPVLANIPAAVTISCEDTLPGDSGTVTATDSCSGDITGDIVFTAGTLVADPTCPNSGTITHTWTVNDGCGNTDTQTQVITVTDTVDPVLANIPAAVTISCEDTVPGSGTVTATDSCSGDITGDIVFAAGTLVADPTCPNSGTITHTWTVNDGCGNTDTQTQVITVTDTVDPVLANIPATVTISCEDTVPGDSGTVTATDSCSGDITGDIVFAAGTLVADPTCPNSGTITHTWTVNDGCGNTDTQTQVITVTDTVDPVLANIPAAVTISCEDTVPGSGTVTATDSCSGDITGDIVFTAGTLVADPTCPNSGTITHTWTVDDGCGNTDTQTQTINVEDTTAPTASNPITITIPGGPAPAPDVTVVTDEADNCGGTPVVAFVSDVSDNGTCPETITRTYSVTDECLNTINVTQTILITDPILPTASNPTGIDVQCIEDVPTPDVTVVTDEADNQGTPNVEFVSDVSDGNTCPEVITRTYSVTDVCDNQILVTQTIIVNDTTLPTATGTIADSTVEGCTITDATAAVTTVAALEALGLTIGDNCTTDANLVVTSADTAAGTCPVVVTRTYTITDACGNAVNASQTINVEDTTAPTASNPITITIPGGPAPAPDVTVVTDEADNCGGTPIVAFVSDSSDNGTCPETITRTYSVTDECLNTINVTQTILITDPILPTASNPAGIDVQCIDDVPAPDVTVVTDEADNQGTPNVEFVSDVSDGNTCPEVITRTYSVTDICDNQILVTQTIIVNDTTLPTATGTIADSTVEGCTITDATAAVTTVAELEALGLTIGDNCTTDTNLVVTSADTAAGTCPLVVTRTYTITDACGNAVNAATQTINVEDTTAPTASNPITITIPGGPAPAPDVTVVTDEADNCGGTPVVAFVSDVSDNGTCPETITRTYSVTDECLNTINVTQTILITDPILPTASNPTGIDVQCIEDVPTPDVTVVTDEADNQGTPNVEFVSDVSDGNTCPEVITRTYSVTDVCDNQILVTQTIIVNDTTLPTATGTIADSTVEGCTITDATAAVTTVAALEALGLTIGDNCTTDANLVVTSADTAAGTCPVVVTRTYTITDACGNAVNASQTINVEDTTAPTASNPITITIPGGPAPAPDVTVVTDEADNCGGTPIVAFVSDSSDNGTCPETITRTYSVTDECLNTINVTQTILITDPILPTASNPAGIDVQCIDDVPAPDVTVVTDEADNQGTPNVEFVSDVSDGNTCPEVITRTYSVTDICDNQILVTQTIIVNDTTLPTATGTIADSTVEGCTITDATAAVTTVAELEALGLTIGDNCTTDTNLVVTSADTAAGTCPLVVTRTYTITDACGNAVNAATQTINVEDTTAPTASNPITITIPGGPAPAPDVTVVTDEADNCGGTPIVAFVSDSSDNGTCPETITRTYSVTDECLNTINVTQTILITDPILPTASNPAGIDVQCIDDVPAPDVTVVTDEADNQGTPNVEFVSDVSDGNTCPEVITRTYSVTDVCDNQILVTQTIIVNDTTLPTATGTIADSTVEGCTITDATAAVTTVAALEALGLTIGDNCTTDANLVVTSADTAAGTCPVVVTRTYTITDACGNAVNAATQTINVEDTTAPTASNPITITIPGGPAPAPDITVVIDEADNCGGTPVVAFVSDVSDNGTCPETITRTYSVTDECLNTINVTQTILITDPILPTASNPTGIDVQCIEDVPTPDVTVVTDEADNQGTLNVEFVSDVSDGNTCPEVITRTYSVTDVCDNQILVTQTITVNDTTLPTATGTIADSTVEGCTITDATAAVTTVAELEALGLTIGDNCTTDANLVVTSADTAAGTCPVVVTRTYTITDACGNAVNAATQTINVEDTTAPILSGAIPTTTIEGCTATDAPEAVNTITDLENLGLTISDGCSSNTLIVVNSSDSSAGTCPIAITRTYTVTDACGNSTMAIQTIFVDDTTLPVLTLPANVSAECSDDLTPSTFGEATAIDNCDANPAVTFIDERTDGVCSGTFTITRTWTATDACGNSISDNQIISTADTTAPEFVQTTLPGDLVVECNDIPDEDTLTATDNCGSAEVTVKDERINGSCPNNYVIKRSYTATDECGVTNTHVQTITVQDSTPPVFVEALPNLNIVVECDNIPEAQTLTATDICGSATVSVSDSRTNGDCPNSYRLARTWVAEDECGLQTTYTQNIIVQDTTPPAFVETLPRDTTVECDMIPETTTLTAIDNCGDATVTVSDVRTNGDCPSNYIIERTWVAEDECGLKTTHTQVITVQDTTAPEPESAFETTLDVSCTDIPEAPEVKFIDNCSSNVIVDFTETNSFDENVIADYQIVRTWTVRDACNNEAEYTQTLNVALDEILNEINAEDVCFDNGVINLDNFLAEDVYGGTWEIVEGNTVATISGSVFDPTNLETAYSEDFNPNTEGILYVLRYSGFQTGCLSITDVFMVVDAKCKVLPCGEKDISISTAITPNGDNINETFDIEGITFCGFVAEVKIFNRWGALVHETNEYKLGSEREGSAFGAFGKWDGLAPKSSFGSNGKLPNGTYYYIIKLFSINTTTGMKTLQLDPITGPVYLGTK